MAYEGIAVPSQGKGLSQMSEGQFVATVAHELKAPLHTIETIAHSAQQGLWGKPSKALFTQLTRVELSARQMLEFADSLLRLEQVKSGRLEPELKPQRVTDLIEEVCLVVDPFLRERDQELIYQKARELPPILIDPLYSRHALLNILLNAAKYSPDGGCISVSCHRRDDVVCIEVSDQANSLGAKVRRQITSPTLLPEYNRQSSGYGMGLFIASRFAHSVGGSLQYVQVRSGGNRFKLCLPIARQLTLFGEDAL